MCPSPHPFPQIYTHIAPDDYFQLPRRLFFPPQNVSVSVPIGISDDEVEEFPENFFAILSPDLESDALIDILQPVTIITIFSDEVPSVTFDSKLEWKNEILAFSDVFVHNCTMKFKLILKKKSWLFIVFYRIKSCICIFKVFCDRGRREECVAEG